MLARRAGSSTREGVQPAAEMGAELDAGAAGEGEDDGGKGFDRGEIGGKIGADAGFGLARGEDQHVLAQQVGGGAGMEGEVVITQDLYTYVFQGEDANGKLIGEFKSTGLRPNFCKQAAYFGLEKALLDAM